MELESGVQFPFAAQAALPTVGETGPAKDDPQPRRDARPVTGDCHWDRFAPEKAGGLTTPGRPRRALESLPR